MTLGTRATETAGSFYERKDAEHWQELESILTESGISLREMLVNYTAFVRRRELVRLLADYDLFRMIVTLPGSIAELSVYLGAGLITWSKLLETFCPGDRSRKVYWFESGGGYGHLSPEDGNPQPWIEGVIGNKVVPEAYLERMVALTNNDNILPGIERCCVARYSKDCPRVCAPESGHAVCAVVLRRQFVRADPDRVSATLFLAGSGRDCRAQWLWITTLAVGNDRLRAVLRRSARPAAELEKAAVFHPSRSLFRQGMKAACWAIRRVRSGSPRAVRSRIKARRPQRGCMTRSSRIEPISADRYLIVSDAVLATRAVPHGRCGGLARGTG
jgi:hypothetical protein